MSPITHFLASWLVANAGSLNRKERVAVVLAGISPDIDGIGIVAEAATKNSETPLLWWSKFHHVLAHNLLFGLMVALICGLVATRRLRTAALAFLAFHLHLFGDLIGAKGPEGDQWPIPYLWPFNSDWQWAWSGQWALNAWPNFLITSICLIAAFYLAWWRGFSPVGLISEKGDGAFVAVLRRRFGSPST